LFEGQYEKNYDLLLTTTAKIIKNIYKAKYTITLKRKEKTLIGLILTVEIFDFNEIIEMIGIVFLHRKKAKCK
jgi:hypothetical protein